MTIAKLPRVEDFCNCQFFFNTALRERTGYIFKLPWKPRLKKLVLPYVSLVKFEILLQLHLFLLTMQNSLRPRPHVSGYESATFSLRVQKFSRQHVAYSNRICPFTRIRVHFSIQECQQSMPY